MRSHDITRDLFTATRHLAIEGDKVVIYQEGLRPLQSQNLFQTLSFLEITLQIKNVLSALPPRFPIMELHDHLHKVTSLFM